MQSGSYITYKLKRKQEILVVNGFMLYFMALKATDHKKIEIDTNYYHIKFEI